MQEYLDINLKDAALNGVHFIDLPLPATDFFLIFFFFRVVYK